MSITYNKFCQVCFFFPLSWMAMSSLHRATPVVSCNAFTFTMIAVPPQGPRLYLLKTIWPSMTWISYATPVHFKHCSCLWGMRLMQDAHLSLSTLATQMLSSRSSEVMPFLVCEMIKQYSHVKYESYTLNICRGYSVVQLSLENSFPPMYEEIMIHWISVLSRKSNLTPRTPQVTNLLLSVAWIVQFRQREVD